MSQFWPARASRIEKGQESLPIVAAGASLSAVNITFAYPFAAPPVVVATPSNTRLTPDVLSTSATGAVLQVTNWTASAAAASTLSWIAVG